MTRNSSLHNVDPPAPLISTTDSQLRIFLPAVKVTQRIILNHYTAKRLWNALSMALQRHEKAFGVLETDVRKRVRGTGG